MHESIEKDYDPDMGMNFFLKIFITPKSGRNIWRDDI